jgi:hypothetical protein
MYFIPQLTTSIISVAQLDESGYEVKIKGGVMSLRDDEQRMLVRIQHSTGRQY